MSELVRSGEESECGDEGVGEDGSDFEYMILKRKR